MVELNREHESSQQLRDQAASDNPGVYMFKEGQLLYKSRLYVPDGDVEFARVAHAARASWTTPPPSGSPSRRSRFSRRRPPCRLVFDPGGR